MIPEFIACSLVENEAGSNGGGGIYFEDCGVKVVSSIVWDNKAGVQTNYAAQIRDAGSGSANVDYSCVKNIPNPGTDGNIDDDPDFLDPTGADADTLNDFWLKKDSPCIDASDSTDLPSGVTDDLAESTRRIDDPCTTDTGTGTPTYVDMGTYEYDRCFGVQIACDPANPLDCDSNSEVDLCEIDLMPGLDMDANGGLDSCQPAIVHGAANTSFAAHAYGGYVDPRRESNNGVDFNESIEEITIVFTESVYGLAGANQSLQIGDFEIGSTGGTAPTITAVDSSNNPTVSILLSGPLPVQEWTTIEANVSSNATGYAIVEIEANNGDAGVGVDEPDRVDIGFLPCDVNQNQACDVFDLLKLSQYIQGSATPPMGVVLDYTDINRNGSLDPFDVLSLRQLLDGVSPATQVWLGVTMASGRP